MACFLLVTFLPDLPLFNVPFFRLRIAFSTDSPAFLLYFAIETPFSNYLRMTLECFGVNTYFSSVLND